MFRSAISPNSQPRQSISDLKSKLLNPQDRRESFGVLRAMDAQAVVRENVVKDIRSNFRGSSTVEPEHCFQKKLRDTLGLAKYTPEDLLRCDSPGKHKVMREWSQAMMRIERENISPLAAKHFLAEFGITERDVDPESWVEWSEAIDAVSCAMRGNYNSTTDQSQQIDDDFIPASKSPTSDTFDVLTSSFPASPAQNKVDIRLDSPIAHRDLPPSVVSPVILDSTVRSLQFGPDDMPATLPVTEDSASPVNWKEPVVVKEDEAERDATILHQMSPIRGPDRINSSSNSSSNSSGSRSPSSPVSIAASTVTFVIRALSCVSCLGSAGMASTRDATAARSNSSSHSDRYGTSGSVFIRTPSAGTATATATSTGTGTNRHVNVQVNTNENKQDADPIFT